MSSSSSSGSAPTPHIDDVEGSRPALVVPKVKLPPILPIFQREAVLAFSLALCIFAACSFFTMNLSWAYQPDQKGYEVPLANCPAFPESFTISHAEAPSGPTCKLEILQNGWNEMVMYNSSIYPLPSDTPLDKSLNDCRLPQNGEQNYECFPQYPCHQACRRVDDSETYYLGECPDPASLPDIGNDVMKPGIPKCQVKLSPNSPWETLFCKEVLTMPYCSSKYDITPSNILGMRGIILAGMLLVVIWFCAEWVLWYVDLNLRKEKAEGMARMERELPQKRLYLRQQVEGHWRDEYNNATASPEDSGSLSVCIAPAVDEEEFEGLPDDEINNYVSRDPAMRFQSETWKRRLTQWKACKAAAKRRHRIRQIFYVAGLNIFFLWLLIATLYIVLYYSPQNILATTRNVADDLYGEVSIWNAHSWLDILIFIDVLLDTFLFLIACVFVKWPRAPVYTRHVQQIVAKKKQQGSSSRDRTGSSEVGDVKSRAVYVGEDGIPSPLSDDLISDCTSSSASGSEEIVHPDINYVYIPEGNKTFAFYWVNKYWIPYLAQNAAQDLYDDKTILSVTSDDSLVDIRTIPDLLARAGQQGNPKIATFLSNARIETLKFAQCQIAHTTISSVTNDELCEYLHEAGRHLPGLVVTCTRNIGGEEANVRDELHVNDPQAIRQSQLARMRMGEVWQLLQEYPRREVKVAVLDHGVNFTDPDLAPLRGSSVTSDGKDIYGGWNLINDDSVLTPGDGHGQRVSLVLAAKGNNSAGMVGVAPDHVQLVSLQVCGIKGCPVDLLVKAIDMAIDIYVSAVFHT
ncbi:hypothetical protein FOL47_011211 [Perkinsus chesapeaki]|uniref:subtilisin n=1 Tax=Perkinsus chesapeaki TaxID=330153 RepID=A0A7J6MPP7_PERCH|nr:hypothetical protein FOL47_011211 [Perkinsus chesapeaki]